MCYTSIINIHTTPSNKLILFWLLCVSVALMISPDVFTIYVANITIMTPLIATHESIDPIFFIICSITPISIILIISSMITSIFTILIIAWWSYPYLPYWLPTWSYPFPPYWLSAWCSYTYLPYWLSISTILIINLMIISTISCQIRVFWFGKHRKIFVLVIW